MLREKITFMADFEPRNSNKKYEKLIYSMEFRLKTLKGLFLGGIFY
jgi:hypothetical protein